MQRRLAKDLSLSKCSHEMEKVYLNIFLYFKSIRFKDLSTIHQISLIVFQEFFIRMQ